MIVQIVGNLTGKPRTVGSMMIPSFLTYNTFSNLEGTITKIVKVYNTIVTNENSKYCNKSLSIFNGASDLKFVEGRFIITEKVNPAFNNDWKYALDSTNNIKVLVDKSERKLYYQRG
jgi:hypothetical protein